MKELVVELVESQLRIIVMQRKINLGPINRNTSKTKVLAVCEEKVDQFYVEVTAIRRNLAPLDLAPSPMSFSKVANARLKLIANFLWQPKASDHEVTRARISRRQDVRIRLIAVHLKSHMSSQIVGRYEQQEFLQIVETVI